MVPIHSNYSTSMIFRCLYRYLLINHQKELNFDKSSYFFYCLIHCITDKDTKFFGSMKLIPFIYTKPHNSSKKSIPNKWQKITIHSRHLSFSKFNDYPRIHTREYIARSKSMRSATQWIHRTTREHTQNSAYNARTHINTERKAAAARGTSAARNKLRRPWYLVHALYCVRIYTHCTWNRSQLLAYMSTRLLLLLVFFCLARSRARFTRSRHCTSRGEEEVCEEEAAAWLGGKRISISRALRFPWRVIYTRRWREREEERCVREKETCLR